MNNQNERKIEDTEIEIDLLHVAKLLLQKFWIIIACTVLIGAISLSYAFFFVAPKYEAKAMMYVNNSSFSVRDTMNSMQKVR